MEHSWVLLHTFMDILNSMLWGWLFADLYRCYAVMAVSLGMLNWGLSVHRGKEWTCSSWLLLCNSVPHLVLIIKICKFHRV
jgi:hypothetical protein